MRTRANQNDPLVDARYASWYKMMIDLVSPKNLHAVAGRGTSKTTDIQADRSIDIVHDMPGSHLAWVADTYMNAFDNIIPSLFEGWERKGWREGTHYITDKRPDYGNHWKRPYKPVKQFKHTISIWNGCFFKVLSLDSPASLAGNSFQHLFGDEVKNQSEKKLKKLTPAIRGEYTAFSHSPFYRGRTFTTDVPNPADGEHDWIMHQEKNMDKRQIRMILQISIKLNEAKQEYQRAYKFRDKEKIRRAGKKVVKWTERWVAARKDSTLFLQTSSFANVDILTLGFFKDVLEAEGMESFKSSILTLPPTVKKGERFYANLGEHHFYDDGVRADFYDSYKLTDRVEPTSEALRYCDPNRAIELGVDFGNMCSVASGQERGEYIYILKEFHTLAPEEAPELASKIKKFYRNHGLKRFIVYYDRSGNANAKTKRDWANDLEYHLKHDNDSRNGWSVEMMSRVQGNITQEDEYLFMKNILGETVKELPKVKIDKLLCPNLKSSISLAKTKIYKNTKGSTVIQKNKTSEKTLPLRSLPQYSTNYSDAFKYFLSRKQFIQWSNREKSLSFNDPEVID